MIDAAVSIPRPDDAGGLPLGRYFEHVFVPAKGIDPNGPSAVAYRVAIRRFMDYARTRPAALSTITEARLKRWRGWLVAQGLAHGTATGYHRRITSLANHFAGKDDPFGRDDPPMEAIVLPPLPVKIEPVPEPELAPPPSTPMPATAPARAVTHGKLTIVEYYEQVYRPAKQREWKSPKANHNYLGAVRAFARYAGKVAIQTITPKAVEDFATWATGAGHSETTVSSYKALAHAVLRHAHPVRFPTRYSSHGYNSEADDAGLVNSLRWYLDRYRLAHDICTKTFKQLRYSSDKFSRFLGRPGMLSDLNDSTVNEWLVSLEGLGLAKRSIKGNRVHLLTLWRAAFEDDLVPNWPRKVRRIKVPQVAPRAWRAEGVQRMLQVAATITGHFRLYRVARAAYWRAFILVCWDTGLRLGDVLALEYENVGADGFFIVTQHKTNNTIPCQLKPETLKAIEAIRTPGRENIFRVTCMQRFNAAFKNIVAQAGLKGTTKFLRRSAATAVEAACPGSAMAFLGHKTAGLAYAHYVDRTIARPVRAATPSLL
ncbi:MAG: phage integrase SAM-like domain-containing protein [Pirellulales bacterium]